MLTFRILRSGGVLHEDVLWVIGIFRFWSVLA